MSATTSEFELRPHGGIQLRNKKGELIFWLKAKDPEDHPSFAICYFAPEKADTHKKGEIVTQTFAAMREWARRASMIIFDARDLDTQIRKFMKETWVQSTAGANRTEDITVKCRDMATGRIARLTLGVTRPAKGDLTVHPWESLS